MMRLKLVSPSRDTLLGHIDVPDDWQYWLDRNDAVTMRTLELPRFSALSEVALASPLDIKTLTIAKAYSSEFRGAVYLARGSIEELERLPECSFSPSMAFLRSHLDKA